MYVAPGTLWAPEFVFLREVPRTKESRESGFAFLALIALVIYLLRGLEVLH